MSIPWETLNNQSVFRIHNEFAIAADGTANILIRFPAVAPDGKNYAYSLDTELLQTTNGLYYGEFGAVLSVQDEGDALLVRPVNSLIPPNQQFTVFKNGSTTPIPGVTPFSFYMGSSLVPNQAFTVTDASIAGPSLFPGGLDVLLKYTNIDNTVGVIVHSILITQTDRDKARFNALGS